MAPFAPGMFLFYIRTRDGRAINTTHSVSGSKCEHIPSKRIVQWNTSSATAATCWSVSFRKNGMLRIDLSKISVAATTGVGASAVGRGSRGSTQHAIRYKDFPRRCKRLEVVAGALRPQTIFLVDSKLASTGLGYCKSNFYVKRKRSQNELKISF